MAEEDVAGNQNSCRRPFIPVITSTGGGGKTIYFLQEKHLDHDADQLRLKVSSIADDSDYMDTTLKLNNSSVSRLCAYNPTTPLRCYMAEGGGENLSLGLKRRKPSLVDDQTQTVLPKPSSINVVDDDDVDTALKLSSNNSTAVPRSCNFDPRVYSPTPLRYFKPEGVEILNLGLQAGKKLIKRHTRKVEGGEFFNLGLQVGKKRKRSTRTRKVDGEEEEVINAAVPSIEEFPEVMQAIEWLNGSRPVFLYGKKLEESDVKADQNRVYLTKEEAALDAFMNEAEIAAVESTGLKNIVGVDQRGKQYDLKLKRWPSVGLRVINAGWCKMVAANKAEKGDLVHIWGFRHRNGKLAFAVVFK